ncbi:MAG: hypothetical protein KF708_10500 [Pirellulales bacterium]|nr:hypothetical protein [Pirellulales bacterium]
MSERELASGHDFVLPAIIDWNASAELVMVSRLAPSQLLDEAPPHTLPLRVLYCSWLI